MTQQRKDTSEFPKTILARSLFYVSVVGGKMSHAKVTIE